METKPQGAENADVAVAELTEKIDYLISFFQRRLPAERAKDQLVTEVSEHLDRRTALDSGEAFGSLFVEALQAVDRLRAEEPSPALNASVGEELLEVFARRGLELIPVEGQVNPNWHEVVGVVEASGDRGPGEIALVERDGYLLGGSVLRSARVHVVAASQAEPSAPSPTASAALSSEI